jgi:L-asparaginase
MGMSETDKIHLILTGGTIDSHWDGRQDTAVPNEHSILPQYLHDLQLYADFDFAEVCMKDSRNLEQEDLININQSIKQSPHRKIIITHGTYTMPDTARYLRANLNRADQTIVLTGSMVPLKGFDASDAPFNLGYAFAKVQELGAGIYICMNGRTFSPEEVAKSIAGGKFFSILESKNLVG